MRIIITAVLYLGLLLSFSACQRKPTGTTDTYQSGYDAGYQEGYVAGKSKEDNIIPNNTDVTESPAQEIVKSEFDRTNPAPIGTEQTITDEYQGYTVSININNVTRGDDAWVLVSSVNEFNEAPPEGQEYIVVNATITALSASGDASFTISGYIDFSAFSSTNVQYESPLIVDPEPSLSGDIYEGGSLTGNVTFLVNKSDTAPKLAYLREYDGSGGLWYTL